MNKHFFTVECWHTGNILTLEIDRDSNANDVKEQFNTILRFLSFQENAMIEVCHDE
jgi:hypothetical protein